MVVAKYKELIAAASCFSSVVTAMELIERKSNCGIRNGKAAEGIKPAIAGFKAMVLANSHAPLPFASQT
jgi:hypothetical protein